MPHFFIIDRKRNLHLQEAADKRSANEKFNDEHKTRADHAIEAIPCVHPKRFNAPELPEWMDDIQLTIGSSICYECAAETIQENPFL